MTEPTLPPALYWSASLAALDPWDREPLDGLIDATGSIFYAHQMGEWRVLAGGLPADAMRLVCETRVAVEDCTRCMPGHPPDTAERLSLPPLSAPQCEHTRGQRRP